MMKVTFRILVLVACASLSLALAGCGASTRWEYKLGSVEFDVECAATATAAHKDDKQVATVLGSASRAAE